MRKLRLINSFLMFFSIVLFLYSCENKREDKSKISGADTGNMSIGWASANLTPDKPVLLIGQWPARISEGVMDSITATALAIESGTGTSSKKVIMISCDLVCISDAFTNKDNYRENVRNLLKASLPELKPEQIIINATHTHTAPLGSSVNVKDYYGIDLNVMPPADYLDFSCRRIASAAEQAWKNRKPGGISYGLGHAVVGHNRLAAYMSGKSIMYGKTNTPEFSHLEGSEDPSVNLLYTWDNKSKLTGILINVACPAQESENGYFISADYWHDTRSEVRRRLGEDIFILPQCGAAGDQSPHIMVGAKAEERMQRLMMPDSIKTGRGSLGQRKQIAISIADAVTSVLQYMETNKEWSPEFEHRMEIANLSRRLISSEDVTNIRKDIERCEKKYDSLLRKLNANPEMKDKPRWYTDITQIYSIIPEDKRVIDRYELQKVQPKMPVEIHVLRIGDIVMATNPFELYMDYGIRIKARSPAVQTFVVQLTSGYGGYLPTKRALAGGAYGTEQTSTYLGPEGGQEFVEKTLELINVVWK